MTTASPPDLYAEARISLPSDTEIQIERMFQAPRRMVFEAWTQPESLARWWDPSGVPLAVCEIDLRPGGRFQFVHTPGARSGHVFAGVYRQVAPPDLLVFATPAPGGGETLGTLRFEDTARGTLLVMTMRSPSRDARDMLLKVGVDRGTAQTLDNLAGHLDRTGAQAS